MIIINIIIKIVLEFNIHYIACRYNFYQKLFYIEISFEKMGKKI